MTLVVESRYNFIFGNTWEILFPHFDEHDDYRYRCLKIQGTKAVDTIARRGHSIYFFEMKNYHDSWLEHSKKMGADMSSLLNFAYMLSQELAQKLRDTIAAQVFFTRAGQSLAVGADLVDPQKRLKYVLFLEGDIGAPTGRVDLLSIINTEVNRSIKSLLYWAKIDALLVNVDSYAHTLYDLTIESTTQGDKSQPTDAHIVNETRGSRVHTIRRDRRRNQR